MHNGRPNRTYAQSPQAVGGANTQAWVVYVDDAEAHCSRAWAVSAVNIFEPNAEDFGEDYWANRSYETGDPEGPHWWFLQRLR